MKRMIQGRGHGFIRISAVDVLDMRGLPGAVKRDDDREPDGHLRGGNGDDEKHKHLPVVIRQAVLSRGTGRRRRARDSAAFSIISRHMKMMMILRRSSTPAKPMAKSRPLTSKIIVKGEFHLFQFPFAQNHDADGGHQQQHADHLERQVVAREKQSCPTF